MSSANFRPDDPQEDISKSCQGSLAHSEYYLIQQDKQLNHGQLKYPSYGCMEPPTADR